MVFHIIAIYHLYSKIYYAKPMAGNKSLFGNRGQDYYNQKFYITKICLRFI